MDIPFLKKFKMPKIDISLGRRKTSFAGVDIGASSVKVVQLRKEEGRAVLESYGELKSAGYLKKTGTTETTMTGGFLRYLETDIVAMLNDVIRESNITTDQAVFSVPATSALITVIDFPRIGHDEIVAAIHFEAKKYIPIPLAEVSYDWEIIEEGDEKTVKVLFVSVPKEIVNKYKRIGEMAKLEVRAIEVENFSLNRSLVGHAKIPASIVNLGAQTTNVSIIDQGIVRVSHNIDKGAQEITRILSRSINVESDRAEDFKRKIGLSDRPEEKEVTDIIVPVVDSLFREILRIITSYNRTVPIERKVERVILAGGGANLPGLIDYATKLFGLETTKADPFARVVYPTFMQPILREIGPDFSVAVGLAMREITTR